jgi:hypothetical protein
MPTISLGSKSRNEYSDSSSTLLAKSYAAELAGEGAVNLTVSSLPSALKRV